MFVTEVVVNDQKHVVVFVMMNTDRTRSNDFTSDGHLAEPRQQRRAEEASIWAYCILL